MKTQCAKCKAEVRLHLWPNMLTEVNGQTFLETHVKVKTEAQLVENEEALANKLKHTIT